MSTEPQDVDLVRPEARFEPTKSRVNNVEAQLPTYQKHLLCDAQGNFPAELNDWEKQVVETECRRNGFSFWYRNPQQPGQSSLGIAYIVEEKYGIMRPDFLFFSTDPDGRLTVDIVDPHGLHLADALPKLQGLARYAETYGHNYRRIESVAEALGKLRVLDLTNPATRQAVFAAQNADSLFRGTFAQDY
jgi:hypothetical protein